MSIEGHVTREKVGRILDYIELMGGTNGESPSRIVQRPTRSRFERTLTIILSHFSDKPFTSREVQQTYRSIYGEDVPLSTISTYLSRLVGRGVLSRTGTSFEWKYVIRSVDSQ